MDCMDISIFLAKVVGLYLIITAVVILLRHKALRRNISKWVKGDADMMTFLYGIFIVIIGLLWVVSHNIWEKDYRVVITILGWLTLIKGIAYMAFPWGWFTGWVGWWNRRGLYRIWAIVGLALGAYLLSQGTPLI